MILVGWETISSDICRGEWDERTLMPATPIALSDATYITVLYLYRLLFLKSLNIQILMGIRLL
ncbi:hypothetical protein BDW75DRAFT_40447 [Aspergillus navahoensis]